MAAKRSSLKTQDVLIAELQPYPGNPKKHNLDLIKESLEHGQYRAIVVRERDMMILAGHGTVAGARDLGWEKITAHLIECDDDEARRIVLVDNRAPEGAGYDEPALLALLQEAPDLDATGFASTDLRRLTARMETAADPNPSARTETFEVLVVLEDADAQADLIDELERRGLECRALL